MRHTLSLLVSGHSAMACVVDCSGFVRIVAVNIPDIIILVFFVAFVIVFETSLDLHSANTRSCVL